jgi:hypothetical protein
MIRVLSCMVDETIYALFFVVLCCIVALRCNANNPRRSISGDEFVESLAERARTRTAENAAGRTTLIYFFATMFRFLR